MAKYTAKPLPKVNLPKLHQVGKPMRRVDAMSKVVGATVYAGDYYPTNLLYAKVFRSTVPHARIKRLDLSKARALEGVVCVLDHTAMPSSVLVTDMPGQTGTKRRSGTDSQVLAINTVRYIGEAIALVAAETEAIANKALKLIEIEYEELPAVFSMEEALKPGAPVIYEPDNIVSRWKIRKGDVEAGFREADKIFENNFSVSYADHAYLEPEAGVAWVDEKGVINIRVCTQVVEHFRSISLALAVPQNKLRIQGTMVGGGFGGKEDISVEIFLGLLAKVTGRPVRLVYTREESIVAHSKRHPYTMRYRTGVKNDGRITAMQVDLLSDSGGYVYLSPYVLLYSTGQASGPYKVENLHVDAMSVATNNPFTSAFRGFGGPQVAFAYEAQMDDIAEKMGMDPYELRRINFIKPGDTTPTGQVLKSEAWLEETTTRVLEGLGDKTPDKGPVKVGQGFACYMQSYGRITWFHDTSQAWVGLEMDGTATIRTGVPDIGAGQISSLCQIVSEVLGVSMHDMTIYSTDSALTPLAGTSTATRQLYMSGNATLQAANAIRKTLLERASMKFEEAPDNLDLVDGKVIVREDPSQNMPLKELIAICASEGLPLSNLAMFKAPFTVPLDPETGQGDVWPDFTFGCHGLEVAVDTETGEVTVLKSVASHDVGRAINPHSAEGQIQGGSHQGLGWAMMEDLALKDGRIRAGSLSEYLIPTSCDLPETKVIMLESGSGVGPFGAKGIGEPALTPAAPAYANAVSNAIGARIYDIPITPERVLEAVARAKKGQ